MTGIRLLTFRGVPIRLHATAIFLALIVVVTVVPAARGTMTRLTVAIGVIVIVFVSILLHELGHVYAGQAFGIGTEEVTLWGLGGMAKLEHAPETPASEICVSIAGPAVSIALGVIGLLVWNAYYRPPFGPNLPQATSAASILAYQAWYWNLLIGAFNLLPGPPLDGGGVVRGIALVFTRDRTRSIRVSGYIGIAAAAGAVVLALTDLTNPEYDLMLFFAALLLMFGSVQAARTRAGAPVAARQVTPSTNGESSVDSPPSLAVSPAQAATIGRAQAVAARYGSDVVGSEHLLIALAADARPPLSLVFERDGITVTGIASQLPVMDGSKTNAPPLSVAVTNTVRAAAVNGAGDIDLFLAIAPGCEAERIIARLGADLAAMQYALRR